MKTPLDFWRRALALGRWAIIDTHAVWGAIAAPLLILSFAWLLPGSGELRVRIAGFIVTLVGVFLVVWEILEKGRLFRIESMRKRLMAWLKRLPIILRGPKPIVVSPGTGSLTLSASGRGHVRDRAAATATLEERLSVLEENLQRVDDRITQNERLVSDHLRQLETTFDAERRAREETVTELRDRLERLSVGGIDYELMGVVWVVIGNAFATFPGELACIIARIVTHPAVHGVHWALN